MSDQFGALPVDLDYVRAKQRGERNRGVQMCSMLQSGVLGIFTLLEDGDAQSYVWRERITPAPVRLTGMTAADLQTALDQQMPFSSWSTPDKVPLKRCCATILILLGDSATANLKLQSYQVLMRTSDTLVVCLVCQAHRTNTCSNDQIRDLDVGPTLQGCTPPANALGPVFARGRGRGR